MHGLSARSDEERTPSPRVLPPDVLALPHPDWVHTELTVTGPEAAVAAFRRAAAGAGVVPWHYDYDRMEEDWFLRLVSPPPPLRRTIGIEGARILASQLRDAVWEQHEAAISQVGVSTACPFDLHSLAPVPPEVLRLGPDTPEAVAWLWENWGTTWPLRRVTAIGQPLSEAMAASLFRIGFWSADWSPWAALRRIADTWPDLRLKTRPADAKASGDLPQRCWRAARISDQTASRAGAQCASHHAAHHHAYSG